MDPSDPALDGFLATAGYRLRHLSPLQGDVSPRRYFRLRLEERWAILAVYPPEVQASCERFERSSELLRQAGVRTPEILASDCRVGWMLLEDLGGRTLFDLGGRPWSELQPYLGEALEIAARIRRLPVEAVAELGNPPLEAALLRRELDDAWERILQHLEPRSSAVSPAELHHLLWESCQGLEREAQVPCHRDFMGRNLVPLAAEGTLAVLDHQDLRLGPGVYDVASMLNDSLFPPAEVEEELLACHLGGGLETDAYRRAAVQRTVKAAGTFLEFADRGSQRHLPLVGPTLGRSLYHLERLPAGRRLAEALSRLWQPLLD